MFGRSVTWILARFLPTTLVTVMGGAYVALLCADVFTYFSFFFYLMNVSVFCPSLSLCYFSPLVSYFFFFWYVCLFFFVCLFPCPVPPFFFYTCCSLFFLLRISQSFFYFCLSLLVSFSPHSPLPKCKVTLFASWLIFILFVIHFVICVTLDFSTQIQIFHHAFLITVFLHQSDVATILRVTSFQPFACRTSTIVIYSV